MSSILTTGRVSFFFIYSHLSMLYWHRWGEGRGGRAGGGGEFTFSRKFLSNFLPVGKNIC